MYLHLYLFGAAHNQILLCRWRDVATFLPLGTDDRPELVDCPDCRRHMVRWDGKPGLPSWTAYRVDSATDPGTLIVAGIDGDAAAKPGDWLIDLGRGILVLKGNG